MQPSRLSHSPLLPTSGSEATLLDAALEGLTRRPRQMSPKWFYDARGSELFEHITELPEYYPTRTEIALFERCMAEMVAGLPMGLAVIELGSGSSRKTPLLLDALKNPLVYAPVDISRSALDAACQALRRRYPALRMLPVEADFTADFDLPDELRHLDAPRLVFFPGSTLGNLHPHEARSFLTALRLRMGRGARLLIGLDTVKDRATLVRAYDDAAGVTAAFNLNLLVRLNREPQADFDLQGFRHEARWNTGLRRVEMHLVSRCEQQVQLAGSRLLFHEGESIHTESSYKYAPADASALFQQAGWTTERQWLAPGDAFGVYRLRTADPR